MIGKLSISGDDDDWQVFGKRPPAALDRDAFRAGIKASNSADTILLKIAPVGEKEAFFKGPCLSSEEERAAIEKAQQQSGSGGTILGKQFGR
jgi:hypothetical protein